MLMGERDGSVRSVSYGELERGGQLSDENLRQYGIDRHRAAASDAAYLLSQPEPSSMMMGSVVPILPVEENLRGEINPFVTYARTDSDVSDPGNEYEFQDISLADDPPALLEIKPSQTATIMRKGRRMSFKTFRK